VVDGGEPGVDSRDEGKQNTEHIFIRSRRCCCFTRYSNIFANSELRRDIITDIHAHAHRETYMYIQAHTGRHRQTDSAAIQTLIQDRLSQSRDSGPRIFRFCKHGIPGNIGFTVMQ